MMPGCSEIRERLSAWIDGELDEADARAVGTHLESCAGCRGVADDLTRLRAAARGLGPIVPPAALQERIRGALPAAEAPADPLAAARPERRTAWPQWVGLAAALVLVTAGSYLVSRITDAPAAPDEGNAAGTSSVETLRQELDLATAHYENVIAELEAMTTGGDDRLSGDVAATLRDNILVIDAAIAESRAALDAEPASQPARTSLLEALSQKVSVLQATVSLINRMRLGDPEGAAAAIAGIGSES